MFHIDRIVYWKILSKSFFILSEQDRTRIGISQANSGHIA